MKAKKNKLAEFLQGSRETAGLSQADVASKLGYSTPQFISNWERGLSLPPLKVLRKIASLYKVDVEELFQLQLEVSVEHVAADMKKKFYGR